MQENGSSPRQLVQILAKTPAFSEKGAERFLEWLWKKSKEEREALLKEWTDFTAVGACEQCFYFSKDNLCRFCQNPERDKSTVCLTVSPFTIDIIEQNADFNGTYFALGEEASGHHNLKKIKIIQTRIEKLKDLITKNSVKELILATDFTSPGEATAQLIKEILAPSFPDLRISRLGRGFHSGDMISYGDPLTIKKALEGRE